jgi:hypothetical protein
MPANLRMEPTDGQRIETEILPCLRISCKIDLQSGTGILGYNMALQE